MGIVCQKKYPSLFRENLKRFDLTLQKITHVNFNEIKNYFEQNKEMMYSKAERAMVNGKKICYEKITFVLSCLAERVYGM